MKIAVISDIHYGYYSRCTEFSVPGENIQDSNHEIHSIEDGFVKLIKEHDVEYLVVAGDLTSLGSPQEFHYCEEKLISIANNANICVDDIIVCLGNHDIDWEITKLHENHTKSDTSVHLKKLIKDKYENIAAHVSIHSMSKIKQPQIMGPIPYCGVSEKKDVIFFILNSGFQCAHDQTIKHGKLAIDQLRWFEEITSNYINDTRMKILLLHHHPHNYKYNSPSFDFSTLEEGAEIEDISGKLGIDLVIHGHRHHPRATTKFESDWLKPVSFLCAGSFSVNAVHRNLGEIPNTFHIVELSNNTEVLTLYNYEFKKSSGWVPLQNYSEETPLDYKMNLGILLNEDELKNEILNLPILNKNDLIKWDSLSDYLKCTPCKKLNELIWKYLSQKYDIIGELPKDIMFRLKEVINDSN